MIRSRNVRAGLRPALPAVQKYAGGSESRLGGLPARTRALARRAGEAPALQNAKVHHAGRSVLLYGFNLSGFAFKIAVPYAQSSGS